MRHGVMVVGLWGVDKLVALWVLLQAMEQVDGIKGDMYVINPNSSTRNNCMALWVVLCSNGRMVYLQIYCKVSSTTKKENWNAGISLSLMVTWIPNGPKLEQRAWWQQTVDVAKWRTTGYSTQHASCQLKCDVLTTNWLVVMERGNGNLQ